MQQHHAADEVESEEHRQRQQQVDGHLLGRRRPVPRLDRRPREVGRARALPGRRRAIVAFDWQGKTSYWCSIAIGGTAVEPRAVDGGLDRRPGEVERSGDRVDGADGQLDAQLDRPLGRHRDAPVVDAVVDGEQLQTSPRHLTVL